MQLALKLKKLSSGWRVFILSLCLFGYSLFILSLGDAGWQKGAYKCLQSVFFIMFLYPLIRGKKSLYALSFVLAVNIANVAYYSQVYGPIDAGTILSIFETNGSELIEFFYTLDGWVFSESLVLGIIFFVFCVSYFKSLDAWVNKKYKLLIPFIFVALTFVSGKLLKGHKFSSDYLFERSVKFLEQDVHAHFIAAFGRYKYIMNKYEIEINSSWQDVKVQADDASRRDVYVVFIGESARRDSFHFYGSPVLTTPPLEELSGASLVDEAISPAVQTRESLSRILAMNDKVSVKYSYNIVDLAASADFETYWLSNQSKVGENDTSITMIAKRADKTIFLNNGHYSKAGKDITLVDEFKKVLDISSNKKIIFIHTMGSHNSFCARVWNKKEFDHIDKKDNCYYNSIHNGFELIRSSMQVLKDKGLSYKAVYFSDHGLVRSKKSPYFIHGTGKVYTKEAVRVPLLFIDSELETNRYIKKTYFLRDFVHTFAHWIDVEARGIDKTKSILSFEFKDQENYIMKSNFKVESY